MEHIETSKVKTTIKVSNILCEDCADGHKCWKLLEISSTPYNVDTLSM